MKNLSSTRAKALAISKAVKDAVWERDGHRCIISGSPNAFPEAHYIPRSQGGLGVEENIVTLSREEHHKYDFGTAEEREERRTFICNYLKSKYPDWDEDKLIYHKGESGC